ncbi:hypothetical protein F5Y13DRAFT_196299 [Hypoxylon sp. FL1857]|nr:hypothetical protein F5Y13DRAFT_196299 [Hypoxylon sp. FL1857]
MDSHPNGQDLVAYVQQSLEEGEEFQFLSFESLQRLNIAQIQVKLAKIKSCIQKEQDVSSSNGELLQKTLQDYATAIRDYQFIRGQKGIRETEMQDGKFLLDRFFQSAEDFDDPFPIRCAMRRDADDKIDPIREAFMSFFPSRLTWSKEERRRREREYMEGKPPKKVSKFVDHSVRLLIALTGALLLGVPLVVIATEPSMLKSMAAGSSFVLFFALVLAFGVKVSNLETLISTFAYAAALFGIIGTTMGCNNV